VLSVEWLKQQTLVALQEWVERMALDMRETNRNKTLETRQREKAGSVLHRRIVGILMARH